MIYEGTITFIQVDDKGIDRAKKQMFVIDNAEIFFDAENRLYKYADGLTAADVVAVKRSKVKEIVNERKTEDDLIWLTELQDVFLTDEGEEKELRYRVLVFAKTFDDAKAILSEYIKQGYSMEIVSIKKTKFDDVLY